MKDISNNIYAIEKILIDGDILTNRWVSIQNATRDKNHSYYCRYCKCQLDLVINVPTPHYRHRDKDVHWSKGNLCYNLKKFSMLQKEIKKYEERKKCDEKHAEAMDALIKIMESGKSLTIVRTCAKFNCVFQENLLSFKYDAKIHKVQKEKRLTDPNGFADVAVSERFTNKTLYVFEVFYTHRTEECRRNDEAYKWYEFDADDIIYEFTEMEDEQKIVTINCERWKNCPSCEKKNFEKLELFRKMKRNKHWYEWKRRHALIKKSHWIFHWLVRSILKKSYLKPLENVLEELRKIRSEKKALRIEMQNMETAIDFHKECLKQKLFHQWGTLYIKYRSLIQTRWIRVVKDKHCEKKQKEFVRIKRIYDKAEKRRDFINYILPKKNQRRFIHNLRVIRICNDLKRRRIVGLKKEVLRRWLIKHRPIKFMEKMKRLRIFRLKKEVLRRWIIKNKQIKFMSTFDENMKQLRILRLKKKGFYCLHNDILLFRKKKKILKKIIRKLEMKKLRKIAMKKPNKKKMFYKWKMEVFGGECRLFDFHVFEQNPRYRDTNNNNILDKENAEQFMIRMFGIDEKRRTYSILVKDFKPFFYVKIDTIKDEPESFYEDFVEDFKNLMVKTINEDEKKRMQKSYESNGKIKEYRKKKLLAALNNVNVDPEEKNAMKFGSSIISKCEHCKHKTLYGFDAGKNHHFIFIEFHSKRWMNKVIHDLWYNTKIDKNSTFGRTYVLKDNDKIVSKLTGNSCYDKIKSLPLYETKLPPLLRYFHIQKISPSGWIKIKSTEPFSDVFECIEDDGDTKKQTSCRFEYLISHDNIVPLKEKETAVPYKICSFDIEASSSHGDFPLAKKDYKKVVGEMLDHINLQKDKFKTMSFDEKCDYVENMFLAVYSHSVSKHCSVLPKKNLDKKMMKNVKNEVRNFKKIREQFPFMSDVYVKENALRDPNYVSNLKNQVKKLMKFPLTYFIRKKKKKDYNDNSNAKPESKDSESDDNDSETGENNSNEPKEPEEDDGINVLENQIGDDDSFNKKKPWLPFIPSKYLYEAGDEKSSNNDVNKITSYLAKDNVDANPTNEYQARGKEQYKNMKNNSRNFVYMLFCDLRLNQKMAYLQKALEYNWEKREPQPLPVLKGDEVTFIGSTFINFGESEPYLNHCVVKDSCADHSKDLKTEIVECGGNEGKVLREWSKMIREQDPDIIIGYNIFGFDWKFMVERAEELGFKNERNDFDEFYNLSRLNNHRCRTVHKTMKIASGTHELQFVKIPGRIQIDLYNYFRREINLSSYKLDAVSAHFIGDGVKEVVETEFVEVSSPCKMKKKKYNRQRTLTLKSKNLMGLADKNNVCFEIIGHSTDNYRNGKKFEVFDVDLKSGTFKIAMDEVEEFCDKEKEENTGFCNLLQHAKLNHKIRWCLGKDDITPQDIFDLTNEGPNERWMVAKYCIQDCNLVHNLLAKNDIITGFIEIASICSVPMDFIVMRGQGIKLLSLVGQKCSLDNTLMKNLEKEEGEGSYEGAICLPPKKNIYLDDPIAVNDYSSLYPSSMLSENISHDSKVWTKEYDLDGRLLNEDGNKEYDNLDDYEYVDITYDMYEWQSKKGRKKKEKVKVGTKTCRFAQFPDGKSAIMPTILKELLKARKDCRKLIKWKTVERKSDGEKISGLLSKKDGVTSILNHLTGESVDIPDEDIGSVSDTYSAFMKNVFDKRQLGFKVTANSLYGQCGARTSSFYEIDIAASTTATGRKLLMYAKSIVEKVYKNRICETKNHGMVLSNAEYVYGDSVTGDTPLLLRNVETGSIEFRQIDDLENILKGEDNGKTSNWFDYDGFKVGENDRWNKEQMHVSKYQIYTSTGWSNIKRVIRHKTKKDIWRVNTHTGMVDVTEDHSLLDEERNKLKPKDAKIGCKLLHNYPSFSSNREDKKEKTANHLDDFLSYIENICSKTKEEKKAFIYGFFFGDGSCGKYNCPSGLKYSWALNQKDREFCVKMKHLCEEVFGDTFKINDTIKSSGVYKIVPVSNNEWGKGLKKYVEMFRSKCYNKDKYKIIPTEYLNAEYNIRMAYLSGYYAADGAKCRRQASKNILLSNKGKIGGAMLFYMFRMIYFYV